MSETEWRAAVEQMLAWEQAGGDGWWKGFEMLKAAYAAPAPPAQGELEAALQASHNWLRKNANAESKLCREQLNRRTDKLDAFVEAHNAIAEIIREAEQQEAAPQAGVTEQMVEAAAAALYCELDGDASTWDREGENKIVYLNAARAALEAAAKAKR